MSRTPFSPGRSLLAFLSLVLLLLVSGLVASHAATAPNLSFNYRTNTATSYGLYDHPDRIIVLEFYFWWCPHCQNATPRIHSDIDLYYKNRGGNNDGVPVEVVYVSLEEAYPGNQDFVRTNGLELVVNDLMYENYFALGGAGTPHIVVINGVTNSPNTAAWAIVHSSSGFSTVNNLINTLKTRIDAIRAPVQTTPAQLSVTPSQVTFATLTVGQTGNRTFLVNNLGGESLEGTASVSPPFAVVSGSPFNVAPGASGQVVVSFSPVAVGEFNGDAVFTSNGGDTTNGMTGAAAAANPDITPLTLTIDGSGTVKPNLGGQSLVTARSYSMTAVPTPGNLFSNWSGTLSSISAKLTFLMQPFMVLQANFVANPFLGAQGTYNGLFHPEEDLTIENSGFVTATVSSKGAYSGRLQSGAVRSSFRGSFDLNGRATNSITRVGTTPLSVELQLDLVGGNTLTGRVVNTSWSANITMDRAVFNARTNPATNFAGKYTVVLPSDTESPEAAPVGAGFGSVVVSTAGLVSLTGTLGDGTPVRQQVSLSRNGQWPIFVSLYGGKGILIGWATFTGGEAQGVTGEGLWIRQGQPGNKIYAAGFTNEVVLLGSSYVSPAAGVRVVNLSDANVVFSAGDLSEPFSNAVVLGTNNKITNTSTNKLTMTIVLRTGLFSGTVQIPGNTKTTTFKGVLLQNQDSGWGCLTGTNFNGTVFFGL